MQPALVGSSSHQTRAVRRLAAREGNCVITSVATTPLQGAPGLMATGMKLYKERGLSAFYRGLAVSLILVPLPTLQTSIPAPPSWHSVLKSPKIEAIPNRRKTDTNLCGMSATCSRRSSSVNFDSVQNDNAQGKINLSVCRVLWRK
eukprot:6284412-Amphidinium_carterae.1